MKFFIYYFHEHEQFVSISSSGVALVEPVQGLLVMRVRLSPSNTFFFSPAAHEFPTAQSSKKASFDDLTLDSPTKSLNKFIAARAENHAIRKKFLRFYNVVSMSQDCFWCFVSTVELADSIQVCLLQNKRCKYISPPSLQAHGIHTIPSHLLIWPVKGQAFWQGSSCLPS